MNSAIPIAGFSLKGCQIVAGGRSVAQTTGEQSKNMFLHPERGVRKMVAPLQGANNEGAVSGGLRYAATTGYYLTALQAEIRFATFSHGP
jgi:hypothetical protein